MTLRKFGALFFLVAIALTPVSIVMVADGHGGIFVTGYVAGVVTAPLVAIGATRAVYLLAEATELEGLVGVIVYGLVVVLISVAAAVWSFWHATS
jgi:hypothetical protein